MKKICVEPFRSKGHVKLIAHGAKLSLQSPQRIRQQRWRTT
jgi:hypothetical protein